MNRFLSIALAALLLAVPVMAYDSTPPDTTEFGYSAFITMDTQQLGEITLQLPVNWLYNSLSWDGSELRNITTSTITGYYGPDTSYDVVRWSGFSGPQYRSSGSSYIYSDLTVTDLISTNVQLVEDWEQVGATRDTMHAMILILLMGVIVFLLFMKKF